MKKQKLLIVAYNSSYGAASNLNEAINMYSKKYTSTEVNMRFHPGFLEGSKVIIGCDSPSKFGIDLLHNEEYKLFVVDISGFEVYKQLSSTATMGNVVEYLKTRDVAVFWTGSRCLTELKQYREYRDEMECKTTFAMLGLSHLDPESLPLMQLFNLTEPVHKFEKFTLCHSPGDRPYIKGTTEIEEVFHNVIRDVPGINCITIKDKTWEECIELKSRCHLFVDQFHSKVGGLGKSGIEAMSMGIPTLCDCKNTLFTGRYSDVPVIDVRSKEEMYSSIIDIYHNYTYYKKLFQKGKDIFGYESTVKYLDEELKWRSDG